MEPKKNKKIFAATKFRERVGKSRLIAAAALFGLLLVASINVPAEVDALNAVSLRADTTGFASLCCAYLLGILLLAPLSPFALMAGGVFGFWWGTVLALLALNTGAMLAFFIARYFLPQSLIGRLLGQGRLNIVAAAITGKGIGRIALLRLNPLVPFNLQNYVCGAAGVNFAPYSLGTLIGAAPCTIALVYLGHVGRRLVGETGLQIEQWSLLIFLTAAVLTIPLTFTVLRETVQRLRECRNVEATTKESADEE